MSEAYLRVEGNEQDEAVRFAVAFAQALQRFGIPSHRLESAMDHINRSLGIQGQFFSSPSALMASFSRDNGERTFILRAGSGDLHMEKLDQLMALTDRIGVDLGPSEALKTLEAILAAPERYPPWLDTISFGLTSMAAARLFGGGWREMAAAGLIGIGLGLLILLAGKVQAVGRLLAPLAAIGATLIAAVMAQFLGSYATSIATITGLIILIPGLSLTTAMTELATGHPVSGTARLANTVVIFLMLGFGVGLGGQIAQLLPTVPTGDPIPMPSWTLWPALVVVPITFTILFRAKPGDYLWILPSVVGAYFSISLGSQLFGPQLGAFAAAMALGMAGNLFARITRRPAAIVHIPGLILLVPGTVGFRGLNALMLNDTLAGLEIAFSTTLIAVSLAAGLICSNIVLTQQRGV